MPREATESDDLKGLIAASRKRDLSFGLALGKKPEDTAFLLHRTKEPETLLRAVKREDGVQAANSTLGMVRTKGKTLELVCRAEPPPGAARKLRLYLSGIGFVLKVRFLSEDGTVFDDDGEDDGAEVLEEAVADTAEGATEGHGADPIVDPLAERWDKARALMVPRLQAVMAADPDKTIRLRAALGMADAAAAAGKLADAMTILAQIAEALNAAGAAMPTSGAAVPARTNQTSDPAAQRQMLADLIVTLRQDLAALGKAPGVAHVLALFQAGATAAQNGDIAGALEQMTACSEALADHNRAARIAGARNEVSEGKVASAVASFEADIARWRAGRLRSIAGLEALVAALNKDQDSELREIADRIEVLRRDLPEVLEARLSALAGALAKGDRQAATAARDGARGELEVAAGFLRANVQQFRLCESNPFGVEVAVVEPLAALLKDIHTSLARL